MEGLSDKAKVVYATFEMLGAKGIENGITSYAVLDFISENEDLQDQELLKDITETDFVDIIMDLTIKSVNTIIASLCRKDIMGKTEPESMKVDGQRRNLRKYFLK